jgi:uncharacterized protein involved in exopolysaccharide biosynthesis
MTTETLNSEPAERDNPVAAMPVPRNGAQAPEEVSLLDLMIVIADRKRFVLTITAIFALLAIGISLLLPVRYTADVILLPPQQGNSMSSMLMSQLGSMGGMAALAGGSLGLKNPNDQYVGMMRSRTVEDAMVRQFGLMQEYKKRYLSDARKTFEDRSTVNGSAKDGLIHISVEDSDPDRAAKLANGYVEQFRDQSQNLAITEAAQRRVFFEHELEKAKNNLATAEEALKQTEQSTGVIALDSQARALIETAATLRAQISAREVEIEGMQTYATGENAQLVQAQRELDGLRAQLAKLGGSEAGDNSEIMVPKGRVPEAGLEYVRKLRDVKYNETIFEILARQFEMAKLDEAKEGALIQVVDPAIRPDRKSSPKRVLIVILGTFCGFFAGILVALIQEGLSRSEDNPETSAKLAILKRKLSLRKSAALPSYPPGKL